jgi:hypothetical protein
MSGDPEVTEKCLSLVFPGYRYSSKGEPRTVSTIGIGRCALHRFGDEWSAVAHYIPAILILSELPFLFSLSSRILRGY